ncbi:MAG: hypothetical protein ACWA5U_10750 [bacterium]
MRLFNLSHQGLKHWRTIVWVLALLMFVLFVLVGQKLWRLSLYPTDHFDYIASADEQCELRKQACYLTLPTGERVGLTVTPADLPLLTPLEWQVSLERMTAKQVVLDIVGLNMDMGYNRTTLTPATVTSAGVVAPSAQVFRGQALLPICTLDTMQWEARLLIETHDQQRLLMPFRFQTDQRLP